MRADLAAVGDDGLHVVAYFGDATGNGTYSSLDGQRVLRLAAGLDSGLAPYLLADPVVIADITGNGTISSLDATRILQEVVGLDRPEIPPLPGIIVPAAVADPFVSIPTDITGKPGDTITVPINIDHVEGVEAVDLQIGYDPTKLEVITVRPGNVMPGATVINDYRNVSGTLSLGLVGTAATGPGGGSLLEIDFRIKENASVGQTSLDLRQVTLNEGAFVLTPTPGTGPDPTDGLITIETVRKDTAPVTVGKAGETAAPGAAEVPLKAVPVVNPDRLISLKQSTRAGGKNLLTGGFGKNGVTGGVGRDLLIDLSRKERGIDLFDDQFSWNSRINSNSSWLKSFLDDADQDREFGQNSNIKVVLLPGDHVKSKSNGKGWTK